jgi:hypothetical protein
MTKKFLLRSDQIKPVAEGLGACMASDRITLDGKRVGYMYREDPSEKHDSGWRFFSGDESIAYTENPENFAFYDVNTIANYDRSIVPLLEVTAPCAFERGDSEQEFHAAIPIREA